MNRYDIIMTILILLGIINTILFFIIENINDRIRDGIRKKENGEKRLSKLVLVPSFLNSELREGRERLRSAPSEIREGKLILWKLQDYHKIFVFIFYILFLSSLVMKVIFKNFTPNILNFGIIMNINSNLTNSAIRIIVIIVFILVFLITQFFLLCDVGFTPLIVNILATSTSYILNYVLFNNSISLSIFISFMISMLVYSISLHIVRKDMWL